MKFSKLNPKRFFIKSKRDSTKPTSNLPEVSNNSHLEFLEAFKLIDKDNDGAVSRHDLESLLIRLGFDTLTKEDINIMINEVDCNGLIRLEDIASRIASLNSPRRDPTELKETFNFFDADRDGLISAEELLRVFSSTIGDDRCTLDDCKRMIADVDENGDGFVCFEEFSRMMMDLN